MIFYNHFLLIYLNSNPLSRYYGVSHLWVEWTAISYSAFYIILIFPASWLLEQRVNTFLIFLVIFNFDIIEFCVYLIFRA